MKSLFGFQDTLEVVTNGIPTLPANADARNTHKETKKNDCKAMYAIQAAVDSTNFDKISHAETAKQAWDILVQYYEGGEQVKGVKLQSYRRQYELLQMENNESIGAYASKVQAVIHSMRSCGEAITERMMVEKVMRTLTPNFDHVVVAIQTAGQVANMKIEDLVGTLEAHELVINERKKVQETVQAMQAQTFKKNGGHKGKVSEDKVASGAWFLDTGCSNHMTGHKEWLIKFDRSKKSKVKLADSKSIQAEGIGDMVIKRKDGSSTTIEDILYVPGMDCNLLSVGQLIEKVLEDKQNWLWHLRFGHLNFKYLSQLVSKGMVTGLPKIDVPDSDGCLVGKQPINVFTKSLPMRSSNVLEVVHSDVCGPFDEKSLGGNRYFITFVDEYSRKMWIYLLQTKCAAFYVFRKFKALVENQSGKKIKILRTDGGGECPTKKLKVPEEVWSGKKPSVSHFKVFGALCHKHIPEAKRTKLDDRSESMIIVGYHVTGAYKLYNPISKKMTYSRDVIVDEAKTWDWIAGSSTSRPQITQFTDDETDTVESNDEIEAPVEEIVEDEVTNDETRRSTRQRQIPAKLQDCDLTNDNEVNEEGELVHFALLAGAEPINYPDALSDKKWKKAMEEELNAIERNQPWELVKLPSDKKAIAVKWVFKVKLNPDGSIAKYKARLVARGFLQRAGLDCSEVYSPVARIETVRLVIAITNTRNWPMYHMDVKSAFLNGPLEELVFVTQPPGFVNKEKENMVYRLKKALYGLKQAPRD
ncbi:hypothetical protein TSUD_344870 [Trifolium subterraneum]|nr:hypothetical protein TSUD_344870 [Trifolium subterraneum]